MNIIIRRKTSLKTLTARIELKVESSGIGKTRAFPLNLVKQLDKGSHLGRGMANHFGSLNLVVNMISRKACQ